MLEIKDLTVATDGKTILQGFSLSVKAGEVHAIMGPNGAGKSTLAKVLMGHPDYEVVGGEVLFEGKDALSLSPEERAHLGLFISFQYPIEVPGLSNAEFLQAAYNAQLKSRGFSAVSEEVFSTLLEEKMALLGMKESYRDRNLNEGFSGGEKKRNEILQMALLEPKLAVLDEIDSGLDIDALRLVADGVNKLLNPARGLIVITHYQRLLDYLEPTFVHVMQEGKIVHSGGKELALKLESEGYGWL